MTKLHQALKNQNQRRRVTYPEKEVDPKFLTQQQFKNDCDINLIVKNAQRGIAPKFQNSSQPRYEDFTNTKSIEEAYDIVSRAHEAFLDLPSSLRDELGNDPARLPEITREQAQRHGLLKPQTPSQPPQASPSGGQPQPAGTEPAAPPPKGGEKPSSN